jgi:hypothetical protein
MKGLELLEGSVGANKAPLRGDGKASMNRL